MNSPVQRQARLVLLIDADPAMRATVRPLVARHGLDLVQARTGVAALDLVQRMPDSFRMAVVSLELPGMSGALLMETLRLFRPDVSAICLTAVERVAMTAESANCLSKPPSPAEFGSQMDDALSGALPAPAPRARPSAIQRAQAEFAVSGDLLEAARKLARGMPDEPASAW
jgi:DNA-binding response OmpR family regulator